MKAIKVFIRTVLLILAMGISLIGIVWFFIWHSFKIGDLLLTDLNKYLYAEEIKEKEKQNGRF